MKNIGTVQLLESEDDSTITAQLNTDEAGYYGRYDQLEGYGDSLYQALQNLAIEAEEIDAGV